MKVDGKDTSTLDKLEQLLNSHPSIINFAKPEPAEGTYLNRNFEFEIRGIKYKITWFVNLMNLYIGEFEMLFDEIAISSTDRLIAERREVLPLSSGLNYVEDEPLKDR